MTVDGKIYGFPDDGDVFVFYYRKDIFGRPEDSRRPTRRSTATTSRRPRPGRSSTRSAASSPRRSSGEGIYGAAFFREPPYAQFMFQERFRNEGGKFFDAATMKATVNGAGRRQGVHRDARREQVHAARAWRSSASSRTWRRSWTARPR